MRKNLLESVYSFGDRTIRPSWMSWLWGICLLAQVLQGSLYWTWFGPDRNRQLVAASQAVEGQGFTEPYFQPETQQTIHVPLTHWAPGYSIVAAGAYYLLPSWPLVSQLIRGLAILLVFCGIWRVMIRVREWIPWMAEAFLLIFWTVAFAPFRFFNDTDLLSLGFALLASSLLLSRRESLLQPAISVILLYLAAWFRVAYVPFLFLPGIFLWIRGKKILPSATAISGLIAGGVAAGIYLLTFSPDHPVSGEVTDVISLDSFLPENLLAFDAFPVKAWMYLSAEAVYSKAGAWAGMMVSGFLIVLSLSFLIRLGKEIFRTADRDSLSEFPLLLGIVVAMVSFELGWLSLTTPKEIHDGIRTWTYVQETRYFAWPMILISIWTLRLVFTFRGKSFIRTLLRLGLPLCLLIGWTHGMYRHSAALITTSHYGTRWAEEEKSMEKFYEEVKASAAEGEVYIFTGKDILSRDYASIGVLAGGILVQDTSRLPEGSILLFPLVRTQ